MIVFQDLISKLTRFWADRGCIVHQGHDVEVGAGTFNPATFMRTLGPEPYQTVYVEPSRRPQDARFGENPNRVHLFHQLQVVIKPSPLDIQKIYLDSLKVVGIDPDQHDIRFVHDDWESPTLGAWGLGWEVWMDGMEITQFTYFQAVGGFELPIIPVEITYGLERLCMYLQNVDSIFKVRWNRELTFADVSHRNEVEWSQYSFTAAKAEMWLRHFDDYEEETQRLVCLGLPIPAYDFVMKASHAFNVLEARGTLSATERTGYIARIRHLSHLCAESYLKSREALQYPLIKEVPDTTPYTPPKRESLESAPDHKESLLLEIGSEELPATYVPTALLSLEEKMKNLLEKVGLSFSHITLFGTPRRLAILIDDVPLGIASKHSERKGPSLHFAFDEKGHLTDPGRGFFKKIGLTDVTLDQVKKGAYAQVSIQDDYLKIQTQTPALSSIALLEPHLAALVESIHFPKTMRWADKSIRYARPIHWLVALHGSHLIPFHLDGIASDTVTFGHAQRKAESIPLGHAAEYAEKLQKHCVIANIEQRKQIILDQLATIEKETLCQAEERSTVLKETLFLTEFPELCVGRFSPTFLQIPKEVLIEAMVQHQRYFPLRDSSGNLSEKFVITADNKPNATIIEGNEKVLAARLADGRFLYEEDSKRSLQDFANLLHGVTFHKEIGSMADKVERILALIEKLHPIIPCDKKQALQAAKLCKADLTTALVNEFPNLQGVIGKHYAKKQGISPAIALAIEEHYHPRFEGDTLPTTEMGTLLALADKIDTLTAIDSIGLCASSSHDPYGTRRLAIAILRLIIENKLQIDLSAFLNQDLLVFLTKRLHTLLLDYDLTKTEIAATIGDTCHNPYDGYLRAKALSTFRHEKSFAALREVYKRAKGQLAKGKSATTIKEHLLTEPAEKNLYTHYKNLYTIWQEHLQKNEYKACFTLLSSLKDPLSAFFDHVRILCEDAETQANRLALLDTIFALFKSLIDIEKIALY